MGKVKVVPTAQRRPGHCALSKETQGPFLDTGQDVPRYGRIYLSLKWLEPYLRDNDVKPFVPRSEIATLEEELDKAYAELEEATEKADAFEELMETLTPYLPKPEAEVVERVVVKERKPTDKEIAAWIKANGASNPVVQQAKAPEKGSYDEWVSLYGTEGPQRPRPPASEVSPTESDEGKSGLEPSNSDEGPAKVVLVHGQEVNLDTVLALNVKDVVAFAEDKDEDFVAALVRREFFLAHKEGKGVRKGVLEPLGYWDEDTDEPLLPLDEGEEEETEETPNEEEE